MLRKPRGTSAGAGGVIGSELEGREERTVSQALGLTLAGRCVTWSKSPPPWPQCPSSLSDLAVVGVVGVVGVASALYGAHESGSTSQRSLIPTARPVIERRRG